MNYTIYKTTNLINGKYYIGKHQTENLEDGYLGSGKLIKRAIKKYGVENFKKEILFVFDNEQEMNDKEKELVVISEETYNLCPGGQGGFGHINIYNPQINLKNYELMVKTVFEKYGVTHTSKIPHVRKASRDRMKSLIKEGKMQKPVPGSFKGKNHSEETKAKMSQSKKGLKLGQTNSQYGTKWITNGNENRKIRQNQELPSGWQFGRIFQGS